MPVLGLVVCKRLDKVLLPQAVFIEGDGNHACQTMLGARRLPLGVFSA